MFRSFSFALAGLLACLLLSPAQAGLLHHWKFNDGAGTTATDETGAKNGVLTNGATFVGGGVDGGAVSLDGADDHVLMAAGGDPVDIINKSFSISLWALRGTTGNDDYFIGQGDDGTANESLHIGIRGNDQFTFAFWSDDLNYSNGAVNTDTTNFHHWVVTYDSGAMEQAVYLDGNPTPVATRTTNADFIGSGSNDFWVGRRRDGNNTAGLIDDVQVYDHVLTGVDAAFLFANPGVAVPEPSSVALALLGLAGIGFVAYRRRMQG